MVACRYKSGTLSYSGTATSRRIARETCQLITVLLRGGWADQFGASRYATPLSVDSVAAIITATQPPPQMRVRFHAPVSRIVSHRVHARNAINETNKHSRKYTAVYCWTQANFRSRATCQYYNGVHAAYTIPLFHSKLLLLMLAAFIGKRLYVGLVSVRLSVRLSVPLIYNWLHHLYRLYIHLYSPFRWKQKTYTRTYDGKN